MQNNLLRLQSNTPAPFDVMDSGQLAYSLIKFTKNSSKCVRIRRSNDDSETDIGYKSDMIDEQSIIGFCGTGTGYVTTFYEQSGSGYDLLQDNYDYQPIIYDNGIITSYGLPAIDFSGNKFFNETVTTLKIGMFNIICEVPPDTGGYTVIGSLHGLVGNPSFIAFNNVAGALPDEKFSYYDGITAPDINGALYTNGALIDNERKSISVGAKNGGAYIRYNGVTQNILSGTGTTENPDLKITIGKRAGLSQYYNKKLQQIVFFSVNAPVNRTWFEAQMIKKWSLS
ncbi:hypothetical protein DVK85_06625 [Flavobacterium arcticum]|uniref:Uncharacterized protein n=1 Tax=Flavobacterium arcticum TaxID=1784713 RepID=A0A345HBH4_9FLAO|nr:hypothetical protein [Flavobacterium arcticum]AXG73934.1 hypothetical protein DVK85_06625 [Flavobacterium arcticum]KAF2508910.1 hypothetical protein E0W72_10110 [Flavobacterium arcticum]